MTATLHTDRPLSSGEEDRFGFGATASMIVTAITAQPLDRGFVLGLEGKWGSGKSSLLGIVIAELQAAPVQTRCGIVEFRPWLLGDRDALLTALLLDLARVVEQIEKDNGDSTGVTVRQANDIAKQVREYSQLLSPLGKMAGVAGLFLPGAAAAGDVMVKIAEAMKNEQKEPSLVDRKEKLAKALKSLGRRIVVTIDDVDRLEPKEVAELLRLVRSVGDFPSITYLLCYDQKALGASVKTATQVADGRAYLEKIVQVEIAVPLPETFALRRWFSSELEKFARYPDDDAALMGRDRLSRVLNSTGDCFDTPRSVVRTLDAIRLKWPPVRDEVDIADFVWLQIIAVSNVALYRWIENYSNTNTAIASGKVRVDEAERTMAQNQLNEIMEHDARDRVTIVRELSQTLPGMRSSGIPHDKGWVYTGAELAYRGEKKTKRLASPDHARFYFAMSPTRGMLRSGDIVDITTMAATGDCGAVMNALDAMLRDRNEAGGTRLDRFLSVFSDHDMQGMAFEVRKTIALSFAMWMDTVVEMDSAFGENERWHRTVAILEQFRRVSSSAEWLEIMRDVFTQRQSLEWLVFLFRREYFVQGAFGNEADPDRCLLPADQYKIIASIMLERFEGMTLADIDKMAHPAYLFYAWYQAGGRQQMDAFLTREVWPDDLRFIAFLETISNTSYSSDSITRYLRDSTVKNFHDPETAKERVARIADSDAEYRHRAITIRKNWRADEGG